MAQKKEELLKELIEKRSLEKLIEKIDKNPITFELEDRRHIGFGNCGTYQVLVKYQNLVVEKEGVYRAIKINLMEYEVKQ